MMGLDPKNVVEGVRTAAPLIRKFWEWFMSPERVAIRKRRRARRRKRREDRRALRQARR